jgi:D-threo-aldose 1-dehydrogenase
MSDVRAIVAKAFADGQPRIGFGTGDLFRDGRSGDAVRLIETAFDVGYRYFDTARLYGDGQAEHVLGAALARRRDQVVIASKAGIIPWSMQTGARIAAKAGKLVGLKASASAREGAFAAKDIALSVETSLRALRTDYLDVLLLHECALGDVLSDETRGAVERLVREGKVRALGIATRHERTVAILKDGRARPAIVQAPADAVARQMRDYGAVDGLVITHSSIRPVLDALRTDTQLAGRMRDAGIDPGVTGRLVSLLVAQAVAANPGGIVLASTLKAERLAGLLNAPRVAGDGVARLEAALGSV